MATRIAGAYNKSNASAVTSLATSTSLTVAVGDVVVVTSNGLLFASPDFTGVTDGLGNTYSPVAATLDVNGSGFIYSRQFYSIITAAGTATPSVAISTSVTYAMIHAEQGRPAGGTTFALDASNQGSGNSGSFSSGSASASAAGFAVASGACSSSGAVTAGSGWTNGDDPDNGHNGWGEYRTVSGAGSITGDATWANSDIWSSHLIIFKEVAVPSGGSIAWIRA